MKDLFSKPKVDTSAQKRQEQAQQKREAALAKEEQAEKRKNQAAQRLSRSQRAGRGSTLAQGSGRLGVKETLG